MKYKGLSTAQVGQKSHWQRSGSIRRCRMLIIYHLQNDIAMSATVASCLRSAENLLYKAEWEEKKNNEFINLNLTPTWRKK